MEPANLVEDILHATGWTQARLVHELRKTARALHEPELTGLNVVTVNRWKQGRQKPGAYYRRLLRLLHREVDQERLSTSLEAGVSPDRRLLDQLTLSLERHERQWFVSRPDALLPVVRDEFEAVNELRIGCRGLAARRRLDRLTEQAAALTGWLAWLCGYREAASAYYIVARSLATEADDTDGRAFVLVTRSFLHSGLFKSGVVGGHLSLAMLNEAVSLTERSSSPFLRVFALARRAEERAASAGEPAAVGRDLERAAAAMAAAPGLGGGFFSYWNEDRLLGCRGTCAMLQRRPGEAIALLSTMLAGTPHDLMAERSILLADLGAAHAMQGEVEHACDLLAQSLSVGGPGDVNRVGRVSVIRHAHLSSWSETAAVRDLDEQVLAAWAAARKVRGNS